jgi:hypothetical protein
VQARSIEINICKLGVRSVIGEGTRGQAYVQMVYGTGAARPCPLLALGKLGLCSRPVAHLLFIARSCQLEVCARMAELMIREERNSARARAPSLRFVGTVTSGTLRTVTIVPSLHSGGRIPNVAHRQSLSISVILRFASGSVAAAIYG